MTLTTFTSGTKAKASEVNSNQNDTLRLIGQNTIQTLQDRAITFTADGGIFAEAYNDSTGRLNSVDTYITKARFDTDKYAVVGNDIYVIIEATNISSVSDFQINNCNIVLIEEGKWQLYCYSGTDEVKRAQIYKTLFYGTDGTNPRASSTYITGITALKTSISRDIGKRAHLAQYADPNDEALTYTGTFTETSSNTDCSSWSNLYAGNTTGDNRWKIPSGTIKHQLTTSESSEEIGTDLTADELDNPATCQLEKTSTGASGSSGFALILCEGDITWVLVNSGGHGTASNIDFYTDNSIPLFTDGSSETLADSLIYHIIPSGTFSNTISSCFGTFLAEDWESGAYVQYKLTNSTDITSTVTLHDPDGFTNPTYVLDGNDTTYARLNVVSTGSDINNYIGATFSETTIKKARYKFVVGATGTAADNYIYLQTYDGTTWSDYGLLGSDLSGGDFTVSGEIHFNSSIQGIRFRSYWTATTASSYNMNLDAYYLDIYTENEDTGWLNSNEVVEFTAFTAEPDTLIVKLIPKTSNPTAGTPSINGVFLTGTKP